MLKVNFNEKRNFLNELCFVGRIEKVDSQEL